MKGEGDGGNPCFFFTEDCNLYRFGKTLLCFLLFKNVLLGEIHYDGKISIKVKFEDVQIANITFSRQLLGSNNVLIWHFFRDTRQLASN